MNIRTVLYVCVAASFTFNAYSETSASGDITLEGQTFKVVDAIAYHRFGGLVVALADKPFDKEEIRSDGKVDIFDIMGHDGLIASVRISDGSVQNCIDHQYDLPDNVSSSGSSCVSGITESSTLTAVTDEHVAGAVDWKGEDGEHVSVTFDVPVEAASN